MLTQNKYLLLKKSNRLRIEFVRSKSQAQIDDVIQYLKCCTWDMCAVEIVRSDLIDLALEANKDKKELFDVIGDAATFAESVQEQLPPPTFRSYIINRATNFALVFGSCALLTLIIAPSGLYTVGPFELLYFLIFYIAGYFVYVPLMKKPGYPGSSNGTKRSIIGVLYLIFCLGVCWLLGRFTFQIDFFSVPLAPFALFCVLAVPLLWVLRLRHYSANTGLDARL